MQHHFSPSFFANINGDLFSITWLRFPRRRLVDGNRNLSRSDSLEQIDSLCSHLSAFLSEAWIWAPTNDYDEYLAITKKQSRESRLRLNESLQLVNGSRAATSCRLPNSNMTLDDNGFVMTIFFSARITYFPGWERRIFLVKWVGHIQFILKNVMFKATILCSLPLTLILVDFAFPDIILRFEFWYKIWQQRAVLLQKCLQGTKFNETYMADSRNISTACSAVKKSHK